MPQPVDPPSTALAVHGGAALRVRGTSVAEFHARHGPLLTWMVSAGLATMFLASPVGWALLAMTAPVAFERLLALRMRRWTRRLADPQLHAEAEAALLSTPQRIPFVGGLRIDALGHVLLARLEHGDLDGACELVAMRPRDARRTRRQRTRSRGFLGEIVFSILGWLVPGRESLALSIANFHARTLAPDDVGRTMDPALRELMDLHAVLESAAHHRGDRARAGWNLVYRASLRERRPVLHALVLAAVVRECPDLHGELEAAIAALRPAQRDLVARLFPEWARVEDGAPYRLPAVVPRDRARELHAFVEEPLVPVWDRWYPAQPLANKVAMSVLGVVYLGFCAFVMSKLTVMAALSGLAGIAFMSLPWMHSRGRRTRRLAPLSGSGIRSEARLAELVRTSTRAGSSADVADQLSFSQAELLLFLVLHRAEEAIIAGDLAAAIEWMRCGPEHTPSFVRPEPYGRAIAASWTRVTAILGRVSGIGPSTITFAADRRRSKRGVPRSGSGDHPAALGLARALSSALFDRWTDAAAELAIAADTFHEIVLDDDERRLYGELARALQSRGLDAPANLASLLNAPPLPVLADLLGARPRAALEAGTGR